jgi:hypothetical protein
VCLPPPAPQSSSPSSLAAPACCLPVTVSPSPRLLAAPRAAHQCAGTATSPVPLLQRPPHRAPTGINGGRPPTPRHRLHTPSPAPLRVIKGAASPPLHPVPLLLPSPHVQRSRRRSTARPPELRPDLLRRHLSHLSKPPGKILMPSSFFWYFAHAKWWPGGHLGSSPASSAAGTAASRLPPPASRLQATQAARSGMSGLDRSRPQVNRKP